MSHEFDTTAASSQFCSKCHHGLELPPTQASLHQKYPSLLLNPDVNRLIPLCRHCAAVSANAAAIAVECPPPQYTSRLKTIEGNIAKLKNMTKEGVELELLGQAVQNLEREWGRVIRENESGLREAWRGYWGVWGYMKGQEGM